MMIVYVEFSCVSSKLQKNIKIIEPGFGGKGRDEGAE